MVSAGRFGDMAEGKIKETGTLQRRFWGKPLSAHRSLGSDAALRPTRRSAAKLGNLLFLLR